MVRFKLIATAILAVFCLGVVASVASASEGEFVNSKNEALKKNKFTSTSGAGTLETVSGTKVKCTSDTNHGIITSKTGGEVTVLFKGCTFNSLSCKGGEDAAGKAKAGEIIVLLGILIKKSIEKPKERLLLFTIHKTGTSEAGFTEFECSGSVIKVQGSLLTSNDFVIEKLSKTYEFVFKSKGAKTGEQSVTEYENEAGQHVKCQGLEANIEGKGFEKASEEGTDNATLEEEGEFL